MTDGFRLVSPSNLKNFNTDCNDESPVRFLSLKEVIMYINGL